MQDIAELEAEAEKKFAANTVSLLRNPAYTSAPYWVVDNKPRNIILC